MITLEGPLTMKALQLEYLRWILAHVAHGNKAEASRILALDRSSLYRLLRMSDVRQLPSPLPAPGAPRAAPGATIGEPDGWPALGGPDPDDVTP